MSHRQCDRIISAIARQPWAITPDGLELVLGIAQRNISDHQAVLAAPAERRASGKVQMRNGIAIISVMGPIFPRADAFTEISGATSIETLGLRFGEAVAAEDVKGIVLHVDSPGGQITGVHELAGQIFAARGVKPVVAYVSGTCASAAYWLASAAQRVVADKTAMLGSIGVVSAWADDKEARKSAGITDYEVVSSQSPNKRLDPASREGHSALQRLLDETADVFIADVAHHRGKRLSTVAEQFGQGGVMLAAEAVKVGMADEIGSLEGVICALMGNEIKENHMNKDEFKAKNPELYAQIMADARAEFEAEFAAKMPNALAEAGAKARESALALVKAVAGEEVFNRVSGIAAAGVTPEQLAALAPLLAGANASATTQAQDAATPSASQTQNSESAARAEMLAAITNATGGALPTGAEVNKAQKSALVIDAERRAQAQRTV